MARISLKLFVIYILQTWSNCRISMWRISGNIVPEEEESRRAGDDQSRLTTATLSAWIAIMVHDRSLLRKLAVRHCDISVQ